MAIEIKLQSVVLQSEDMQEQFHNLISMMNSYTDIDFIVITGDIVAQGSFDENKKNSIDKFAELTQDLNHNYYI